MLVAGVVESGGVERIIGAASPWSWTSGSVSSLTSVVVLSTDFSMPAIAGALETLAVAAISFEGGAPLDSSFFAIREGERGSNSRRMPTSAGGSVGSPALIFHYCA